jgi:hypothetical protein
MNGPLFWRSFTPEEYAQYQKIHDSLFRDIEPEVEAFADGVTHRRTNYTGDDNWNNTITLLYLEVGLSLAKNRSLSDDERHLNDLLTQRIQRYFPSQNPNITKKAAELALKVANKAKGQTF